MSVSTLYHPPHHKAALAKFWLAVLFLAALGIALAWIGAGSLRGEMTSSGLVFRTIEAGTGPQISDEDAVLFAYEGRLPDGTVFDSSAASGGPQVSTPREMIPGFREALKKMQKGGSYHVVIPPRLGYGDSPPPPIPPDTNLEFDVHIVDVAPGAAAMVARAQPPQQGGR